MAKIKDLTIKTTYKVGLGDVEVPDNVYDELKEIFSTGGEIDSSDFEHSNAAEWLRDNIHQRDCMDCEWEIDDFE